MNHDNNSLDTSAVGENTRKSSPFEMSATDYLADLDGLDLSDCEKAALLQTVWDIMKAFVEMGFDVRRADICGRIFGECDQDENNIADDVKSSFSKATETNGPDKRKERPA